MGSPFSPISSDILPPVRSRISSIWNRRSWAVTKTMGDQGIIQGPGMQIGHSLFIPCNGDRCIQGGKNGFSVFLILVQHGTAAETIYSREQEGTFQAILHTNTPMA